MLSNAKILCCSMVVYIWTNNSAGQMLNYENSLMMFQISALLLLPLLVLYNTWNHWKTRCTLEMDLIKK